MINNNTYNFSKRILSFAKKNKARVGIALIDINQDLIKHLKLASKFAEIVIVGKKVKGFESYALESHEEIASKLIGLIDNKKIDAIVRGQIHPRFLFLPLFKRIGKELSYFNGKDKIMVCVFENNKTKRFFVLSTVDLWQGFDLKQKNKEAMGMVNFLKECGIEPYVGVMTMRRPKPKGAKKVKGFESFLIIEESFASAKKTLNYLKKQNVKADLFDIEYETAVKAGVNIIIPPIGPIGNAIARSLVFFSGQWELISVSSMHFRPLIIEDVFKTGGGKNYYNHIISAAASYNASIK